MTSTGRRTTDDATGRGELRRGLRRLLARGADRDLSSRRAGGDPFPVVRMSPGVWVVLG